MVALPRALGSRRKVSVCFCMQTRPCDYYMKLLVGAIAAAGAAVVAYRLYKSRRGGAVAPLSSSSATQTAQPLASEAYGDGERLWLR